MTDASENALSGWRKLLYRFHLSICPACKAHRHQLETTVGTLGALARPEPSDEARRRASQAFREKRKNL